MSTGVLALTTKGAGKVAGVGMGALSRSVTVNAMREAAFVNNEVAKIRMKLMGGEAPWLK